MRVVKPIQPDVDVADDVDWSSVSRITFEDCRQILKETRLNRSRSRPVDDGDDGSRMVTEDDTDDKKLKRRRTGKRQDN
jgi:hypothetical protein